MSVGTPTTERRPTSGAGRPAAPSRRRRPASGAALLVPALTPVVIFSIAPLLYGIYLGFTDARAGRTTEVTFTGFENYVQLLRDDAFWSSFRIGLIWATCVTALQFVLGLGLALLLNQRLYLRWLARVLALVPWAMPPVVVSVMWRLVYGTDTGILNQVLGSLGITDGQTEWLTSFSLALPAVILVGVWAGMPQTTIVLYAGLQNVPAERLEAAAIDGAGAWQRTRAVTLPALRPVIVAIVSLNFIWNINSFDLVYVLTQGGPGGQTRLPMLFAYEEAFRFGFFGYAAALGNAIVLVVVVLMLLVLRGRLRGDD
jgi:multiple sugar transport system permease protein